MLSTPAEMKWEVTVYCPLHSIALAIVVGIHESLWVEISEWTKTFVECTEDISAILTLEIVNRPSRVQMVQIFLLINLNFVSCKLLSMRGIIQAGVSASHSVAASYYVSRNVPLIACSRIKASSVRKCKAIYFDQSRFPP
jgi:hypothetical protein